MTRPKLQAGQPRLRNNIAALGVVQVSNYLIPLITLPYLTRVLGAEAFGKVVFAQVVMAYFVMLVDYGFSWSATRHVAAQRDDRDAISKIFVATWAAQWLLVLLSAVLATALVLLNERLRSDAWLYATAFTTVIGTVLFPIWFLQGLERLQVVAGLQLLTRLLGIVPIFLFVQKPEDGAWVLLIQGGSAIAGGILALKWIQRKSLVSWRSPNWSNILTALREGGALFGSRVSISLYTTFVPIVLGWLAGPIALAYFNMADKLRRAAQSLLGPLSQALFPRMSYLVATHDIGAFALIKRSACMVILIGGLASLTLFLMADWLVLIVGGNEFKPAALVLRWMSPLPLVIGLSILFGVQIMIPRNLNKTFNSILLTAGIGCTFMVWPLSNSHGAIGAAATMTITELWVTLAMYLCLKRKNLFSGKEWAE